MKKDIKDIDLTVTSLKLENGLEIYVIPKENANNTYATYTARYGGLNNDFIPYNDNKIVSYPKGIAHFLEHKMFEQEDGNDVFNFFSVRGSDANANTNNKKTTYLFSGPDNFYENLEFLLTYVESPYFTEENVEKEKGIIEQEIMMYKDRPYSRILEGILYNGFINHPMKYPVIGTVKSINSITVEDLYDCYNTFYHPSNMFLVVTGNVDPDNILKIVKDHEEKRKIIHASPVELKEYDEPDEVFKDYEEITMPITISKISVGYKMNFSQIKGLKPYEIYYILMNAFDLKVGSTSIFNEKLKDDELIVGEVSVGGLKTDRHVFIMVEAETKKPYEVIEKIKKEIKNLKITSVDLERRKKVTISNLINMSDNIFKINDWLMNDLIEKKEVIYSPIDAVKRINMDGVNKVLNKIDLTNITTFIINPENIAE